MVALVGLDQVAHAFAVVEVLIELNVAAVGAGAKDLRGVGPAIGSARRWLKPARTAVVCGVSANSMQMSRAPGSQAQWVPTTHWSAAGHARVRAARWTHVRN